MELIRKNNLVEFKKILKTDNYLRVLVVSGKNSYNKSGAKKILKEILKKKKVYFFFKKNKLPEFEELTSLIKFIKIKKPNLIISVGGGAVMDLTKIANVFVEIKNLKNKIKKQEYVIKEKFCDSIAIPTTAGSGAEVTTNAVIYVNKIKYSIESEKIKPTHSILIPSLILSNTNKTISASSFDALAQAIESMISVKSSNESVQFSKKAIGLFLANYRKFINNRNIMSAYNISLSAYYAGKAISLTKTTAPHAVSYPFTSFFNVDHGHAVSLTLNEFLRFNFEFKDKSVTSFNLLKRYFVLFNLFKVKNINDLIDKLEEIKNNLKLNDNFDLISKNFKSKIPLIVSNVNVQRLTNNPIRITSLDIYNLLNNKLKFQKK
tara:strand:+ start:4983 stop:6113 length:1131 start_codon:yes stop_codon:yes gene_type:complete